MRANPISKINDLKLIANYRLRALKMLKEF
jgi:hypothetical protein